MVKKDPALVSDLFKKRKFMRSAEFALEVFQELDGLLARGGSHFHKEYPWDLLSHQCSPYISYLTFPSLGGLNQSFLSFCQVCSALALVYRV
ncbi:hypothetical protein Q7C36_015064 [Tachysurus vachellii]|uniref:Uncharacterized protein n=1 Tax=Tachysurus vachellii TaxID=175792 RepID=A0AA88MBC2_TACVA|nr:hypothetical protein Q7C36_015064 [Tachysurus vachellii]